MAAPDARLCGGVRIRRAIARQPCRERHVARALPGRLRHRREVHDPFPPPRRLSAAIPCLVPVPPGARLPRAPRDRHCRRSAARARVGRACRPTPARRSGTRAPPHRDRPTDLTRRRASFRRRRIRGRIRDFSDRHVRRADRPHAHHRRRRRLRHECGRARRVPPGRST